MSHHVIDITSGTPSATVAPVSVHVRPGDMVEWKIDRGCAAIRFRAGASPIAFQRNVSLPGFSAAGEVRQVVTGEYPYDVYGFMVGQDPDAAPSEPGAGPFAASAVLIVERMA